MDNSCPTHSRSDGRVELFILLLVALVLGGAFYWAANRSNDDAANDAASTTTSSTGVVAATVPPPRAYKASGGVNLRSGPGTTFPVVGQLQLGGEVLVVCRTEGQAVSNGPGSTNVWLQATVDTKTAYVSAAFVDTRGDLNSTAIIAVCPPT